MGVLCATPNNGKGIAGIAPEATYVPLVVMGTGESPVSNVITAIYDAVDKYNCKVINISAGLTLNMISLKEAVDYAANKGVIVVCAAGNYGTSTYCYPASYDSTISVGAVDSSYNLTTYSERNKKVDVVTEGGFYMLSNTGGYATKKGTSFSSPIVAGIAALLVQKDSSLTLTTFRNTLKAGTIDILSSGKDYAEVFISPIYETSSGLNVKMFANSSFSKGSAVFTYFNNSRFSGCDVVSMTTSDGVYYKSVSKDSYTSDELHIFAIEDIANLRAISDKNILKY
jgi:subtilisin family serine protease